MEELYKTDLNEPDNYVSVVSYPEPDILNCELKWTLGSTSVNKANGWDKIPVELFETLKVLLSKCCNIYLRFINYAQVFDCVDYNKLWKALKEMGM